MTEEIRSAASYSFEEQSNAAASYRRAHSCQHPMDSSLQPERCGDPEALKCETCEDLICDQHSVDIDGDSYCLYCALKEMNSEAFGELVKTGPCSEGKHSDCPDVHANCCECFCHNGANSEAFGG